MGSEILYGQTKLDFTILPDIGRRAHLTNPRPLHLPKMLDSSAGNFQYCCDISFKATEDHIVWLELPGYMAFDPFLSCLHTIGPRNAALLKTLI